MIFFQVLEKGGIAHLSDVFKVKGTNYVVQSD